ncbi:MAG: STAS domain-containing protein [Mycobacteriales bacterium]
MSELVLDPVEPGQLVLLTGRLDVHAAADARMALADAVEGGSGDLVIDLASLEGVDATGLGVLVGAHRRAGRAGRTLVLRDVQPPVGRLLFLTRLDRVLNLSSSAA